MLSEVSQTQKTIYKSISMKYPEQAMSRMESKTTFWLFSHCQRDDRAMENAEIFLNVPQAYVLLILERGRERNCLRERHQLFASRMCPNWGSNPKLLGYRMMLPPTEPPGQILLFSFVLFLKKSWNVLN